MTNVSTRDANGAAIAAQPATTDYVSALATAFSEAAGFVKGTAEASATQYEAIGRKLLDIAADYSKGLSKAADAVDSPTQKAHLEAMAAQMNQSIDQIRRNGIDAYRNYGQSVITASRATLVASAATTAGIGLDAWRFGADLKQSIRNGDWSNFGATAASLGTATAFAMYGIGLTGWVTAALGLVGSPVIVMTFVAAGGFAFLGDRLGPLVFEGIQGIFTAVSALFTASQRFAPRADPLVLDLDGDGLETVGLNLASPVYFDHNADGIKTGTGWVKSDDAFLVLDRNGTASSTMAASFSETPRRSMARAPWTPAPGSPPRALRPWRRKTPIWTGL